MESIFPITGSIQHYQWGGFHYLATLLRRPLNTDKPQAEYWLGAHPSGPSQMTGQPDNLSQYLESTGTPLNFLLKILDVRDMLSIQVHPNRTQAIAGFAKENQLDIPLHAAHRNYKDQNHKPELMVALSDFWLLHGFKQETEISQQLSSKPYLKPLLNLLKNEGIVSAFQFLLNASDPVMTTMSNALVEDMTLRPGLTDKSHPDFWAQRWLTQNSHILSGIFALYFLNIVHVPAGQGLYQPAGLLHAYLEGINVELMANSDNVLRAGLTAKHIDTTELLSMAILSPTKPADFVAQKRIDDNGEIHYFTPFDEFELRELNAAAAAQYCWLTEDLEILICIAGEGDLGPYRWRSGDAFFITKATRVDLKFSSADGLIYKAMNR